MTRLLFGDRRSAWSQALRSPRSFLWVMGMLVLPQMPFWLAGTGLALQRPVFNLDLVLAAALLCWRWQVGLPVLVLAFALDLLRSASLAYHFATPAELLASFQFAGLVEVRQILSWPLMAGLAGLAVSIGLLAWLAARGRQAPWLLLAAAPFLYGADALNGSSQLFGFGADRARSSINLAGSAGWNVYASWRVTHALAARPMQPLPNPKAYRAILAWMQEHPQGSVLVVIVESMGRLNAPKVDDWLRRQFITERLGARWQVDEVDEDFFGSTTRGELRTLCGVNGHYSRLTPKAASRCLPQLALEAGSEVHGLHGFTMRMFDRQDWWPRIGLRPWPFADGLQHGCNHAFPGVCDAVVLRQALTLVDAPQRFVYTLTLDTHLPLRKDGNPLPADLIERCGDDHVTDTACELVAQFGALLANLEVGLTNLQTAPLIVVVGDHAPPFVAIASQQAFAPARVPLFILRPRDALMPIE